MRRTFLVTTIFFLFILTACSAASPTTEQNTMPPSIQAKPSQTGQVLPDSVQTKYLDIIPPNDMNSDCSISDINLQKLKEKEPDVSTLTADILNTETTLKKADSFLQGETYTGTAYYVSNSGNDTNDGLSPETAWATLDKINTTLFETGDAVFFERGSSWYGRVLVNADNITFSAYGKGSKPIISGSEPGALIPGNWQEYATTADGGTIWLYENAKTDVSHILFDNRSLSAIRYAPDIKDGIYVNKQGEPFVPAQELKEDLSFFSETNLSNWDLQQTLADEYHDSKLYFRCDAGNPAEVFPDLCFIYSLMGFGNEFCGTVIDNINIQCFGSLAVSAGMGRAHSSTENYPMVPSVLVQNCEISFCGGNISNYNSNVQGLWCPNFSGGGLQLSGNGNRAVNNYIHDVCSKVFVVAHHGQFDVQGPGYDDIIIQGNVLVNNGCALHVTDYSYSMTGSTEPCYFDVEFSGNTVLYTGYGWFRDYYRSLEDYLSNHDMCVMDICGISHEQDSILIHNNLFYGAELMLIANTSDRGHPDVAGPVTLKEVRMSNNTYAQYGYFGRIIEDVYTGTDLNAFVKDILKDETSQIIE